MAECTITNFSGSSRWLVHLVDGKAINGSKIHYWGRLQADDPDYLNMVWLWDGKVFRSARDTTMTLQLSGHITDGTNVLAGEYTEGSSQEWYIRDHKIWSRKDNSFTWNSDSLKKGSIIHVTKEKNSNQGYQNNYFKIDYLPPTWKIVDVGYEPVLGVPAGAKKTVTVTIGLESETKEEQKDLSWEFTKDNWGLSTEVTAKSSWGWGSVQGKVAGYNNSEKQDFIEKVKTHLKRTHRNVTTTTTMAYEGPCYVYQAYMTLRSIHGHIRFVRSEFYIKSTTDPNASFDEYIDMEKF